MATDDLNSQYSSFDKSYGTGSGGRIGVVWANFIDGHNNAPLKPFFGITTYYSVNGAFKFLNNAALIAYFKTRKCKSTVYAVIASSKYNDDGHMPVIFNNTYLYQVENNSKQYFYLDLMLIR